MFLSKELKVRPIPCIFRHIREYLFCLPILPPYLIILLPLWYIFIPLDLGCLSLLPLDLNLLTVYTIFSPLQRINRDQVDSLFETKTLPNNDQSAPNLVIRLPLGFVASNPS